MVALVACTGSRPTGTTGATGSGSAAAVVAVVDARPVRVVSRIAVVGASVSAGFGGAALADAIRAAAPAASVTGVASVMMFRDAVGNGAAQIDEVLAAKPELVVAIDFLFWHAYNGHDRAERVARLDRGLADLDRARVAGAIVIVGDVPRIVTASELFLAKEAIPPAEEMAELNARLRAWAGSRPEVLVVPFAAWAEPLAAGAETEIAPGERVPARDLMSPDGLHPNALGVWAIMTRIDRLVEATFGVAPEAWQFVRPPP